MEKLSQNDLSLFTIIQEQCQWDESHVAEVACNFIKNGDGSVRWLWPANSAKPEFLRFYYQGSLRASLFAMCIKLIFALRINKLLFRSSIQFKVPNTWQNWSLFTGTVGPKRKAIIWTRCAMENKFLKIPIGSRATVSLQNEAVALIRLGNTKLFNIQKPLFISDHNNVFVQSDMMSQGVTKIKSIGDIPVLSMMELISANMEEMPLAKMPLWNDTKLRIKSFGWIVDERLPRGLRLKMKDLLETIDDSKPCLTSMAHGDFTPWNAFVKNEQLVVIDWENYISSAPLLFDVFHFIYQNEILNGTRNYGEIRKAINKFFATPVWSNWIEKSDIDIQHYEKLYLITNAAYYIELFAQQPVWHTQVNWLLDIWSEAISHQLVMEEPGAVRRVLLQDIFDFLGERDYAVMKLTEGHPHFADTHSDVDICIDRDTSKALISWLKLHGCVTGVRINAQSFLKQIRVEMVNGGCIHLDLIHSFKRKHLEFMPAHEVLATAVRNVFGIKVPRGDYEMSYIALFYTLNHAPIPSKYLDNLVDRYFKSKDEINAKLATITGGFNGNYKELLSELHSHHEALIGHVLAMPCNNGWSGLQNRVQYVLDKVREMRISKGYIITFSGVDGAGKSTVIALVRERIEKEFRQKVVVLRHRPSMLPILSAWRHGKKEAEAQAATRLPRQGSNKSSLGSMLRFMYYYVDYFFGQFYVNIRYVRRGYVVLYDRYYFDFVNDSKRSNIHISPRLTGALYRLLIKPKYNFLLYAQPDEILKRKQELDRETIIDLTSSYLKHFENLSATHKKSSYIPICNDELKDTIDNICNRLSA